ncbi:uncharacterized protein LOC134475324 [Cavia porcellus]|uniref:uncharacterized protein LOC134475324 n=1 Tax=Cavia porcellus TaxID=10141 RepID=UPI002FE1209D
MCNTCPTNILAPPSCLLNYRPTAAQPLPNRHPSTAQLPAHSPPTHRPTTILLQPNCLLIHCTAGQPPPNGCPTACSSTAQPQPNPHPTEPQLLALPLPSCSPTACQGLPNGCPTATQLPLNPRPTATQPPTNHHSTHVQLLPNCHSTHAEPKQLRLANAQLQNIQRRTAAQTPPPTTPNTCPTNIQPSPSHVLIHCPTAAQPLPNCHPPLPNYFLIHSLPAAQPPSNLSSAACSSTAQLPNRLPMAAQSPPNRHLTTPNRCPTATQATPNAHLLLNHCA